MIPSHVILTDLLPKDILLFARPGPFRDIEKLKFGSPVTHVEVLVGAMTVAAREKGVNFYEPELSGLIRVLRPRQSFFDLTSAMQTFHNVHKGKPYGWRTLAGFAGVNMPDDGMDCSELATTFFRDGGLDLFNFTIPSRCVAPAHFEFVNETICEIVYLNS